MRLYIGAISLITLLLGSPMYADVADAEDQLNDSQTDGQVRQRGWNQWVCFATAYGYYQPFVGSSYFFREGSGEGQQARSIAHLSALRQCQYYTGQQCRSRLESDCRVQRY
ncbi:MAG: hypothetical protein M3Q07_27160 [Pseudobdellovibrionaceae bacterium]|nr:hypothetical protein [Pseudobdellovibrionaceae bacterium]